MSVAPTPAELAREYGESRHRITDLLVDAAPELTALRIPACPEWTVQSLCSHVTGIAADLVARRSPGPDVQAWVDAQIAERADRPLGDVLAEWNDVGPRFEALIEKLPAAFGALVYDVIAHEHDLRQALHSPGARDGAGVLIAIEINRVVLARDLTGRGLAAVRLAAGGHEFVAGVGAVELELDLGDRSDGAFELFRLLGSRRSYNQIRAYPWRGDLDRFLPALTHMPLPEHDLVE